MKYIPIIIFIIILILPALTLLSLRKETGLKQTNARKVIFISENSVFKFSFVSPKRNLNSVVLKLKNVTIRSSVGRNTKPIYFKLLENREIIRQVEISGSNIIEDSDIRFTFPTIENSEDKTYSVILSSPETNKSEEVGINADNSGYPFIITYHIPASKLHLISDVYTNFLQRIIIDKIFVSVWLILLGSFIFVVNLLDI